VHLYPAVPTAENTAPLTDNSISASSRIIIALFPPNSKRVFPNLLWTTSDTYLPTAVDPVNETKGILGSSAIKDPISFPVPRQQVNTLSGAPFAFKTSVKILV